MHHFKQAVSCPCLVNKEAIWVCRVKITITHCHGKSLKATYEPNNRQHVIAFRARLLLLPCLCAALGDLGYSEQGHRKYIKKELLNIDFFFLALSTKINARNSSVLLKLTQKRCFIKSMEKETGTMKEETFPSYPHRSLIRTHESGLNIEATTSGRRDFASAQELCWFYTSKLSVFPQSFGHNLPKWPGLPWSYSVTCAIFLSSWHTLTFTQVAAAFAKKT